MTTSLETWKVLPHAPLAAVDDLSLSLSLDDLPDLPGSREPLMLADEPHPLAEQLLAWSEAADLRRVRVSPPGADPIVDELYGEWQQPSEPLF